MAKPTPVETGAPDETPPPMIHLNDEHVPDGANVGDDVEMQIKGKVANRSEHEDGKSMGVEVHSVKHKAKKKGAPVGRAGGKDADMQDGGKAAMDSALANEAQAEDSEPSA